MDSALPALASFLIAASGLAFIAGGRRSATGLLLLGVAVAAGGAAAERMSVTGLHDLTGILPPAAEPVLDYAFYAIAFLVALEPDSALARLVRRLLCRRLGGGRRPVVAPSVGFRCRPLAVQAIVAAASGSVGLTGFKATKRPIR